MQTSSVDPHRPWTQDTAGPSFSHRTALATDEHWPLGNFNRAAGPGDFASRQEDAEQGCLTGEVEGERSKRPLTIRQLREAAQIQQSPGPEAAPPPPAPRRKTSIFGSLFQVREPTQMALDQVAAQMIAQHGSTSAQKVPNVRMEKMPDFVPKVNSKWDGVPETVKQKERREREKARGPKRDSLLLSKPQLRSSTGKVRGRETLDSQTSSTTSGSAGSRGRSSGSHTTSGRVRLYAQSVNSSGDLVSQQRSDRSRPRASSTVSQSLGSPSSVSFPESVPELPPNVRDLLSLAGSNRPPHSRRESDTEPPRPSTVERPTPSQAGSSGSDPTLSIEAIPLHSRSPVSTPREVSPITPFPPGTASEGTMSRRASTAQSGTLTSVGSGVLGPPAAARKKISAMNPAFLAGEAQELVLPDDDEDNDNDDIPSASSDLPLRNWEAGRMSAATTSSAVSRVQQGLEKRPDSSRARLGLRASMLFRDDDTPWDLRDRDSHRSAPSPRIGSSPRAPATPLGKLQKPFGLFSKDRVKS